MCHTTWAAKVMSPKTPAASAHGTITSAIGILSEHRHANLQTVGPCSSKELRAHRAGAHRKQALDETRFSLALDLRGKANEAENRAR